ncbi:MAG: hypothetical protein ACXW5U_20000 [Thermoanaerobaculia bacterium]
MSILQRIINKIAPCGHEAEIARLSDDLRVAYTAVAVGSKALETLNARHDRLSQQYASLAADYDAVTGAIVAAHPPTAAYVGALESLILQRELSSDRQRELLERAEESTGRITQLEQLLATRGVKAPQQLPLTDVEGGGEAPIAEDEVILDRVVELPLRMVGVFFGQGVGRRHHWEFRYGKEKANMPIRDKEFLARVDEGKQSFRAGDVVLASVHVLTRRDRKGELYPDFVSVERVVKVAHGDQARTLFDVSPDLVATPAASVVRDVPSHAIDQTLEADGVDVEALTREAIAVDVSARHVRCKCGTAIETSLEREFDACERCMVAAATELREKNGTLITREEAAGVSEG